MISLIVPFFNAEDTLNKCILSIREQTFSNVEILLVNDGSTDDSISICEIHANEDSRIKLISQRNNGVSSARNVGINTAKYPYIIFVDSDDYIEHDMCEKMIFEMKEGEYDIVVCGYYVHNKAEDDFVKYPDKIFEGLKSLEYDFSELYTKNFFNSPCNKLYKKKLIQIMFNEEWSLGEDLMFNLEYFKNVNKIKVSSELLYHYNVNHNTASLSNRYHDGIFEIAHEIYIKMNKFCSYHRIETEHRIGLDYQYFVTSYYNFQRIVYFSGKNPKIILEIISFWVKNSELQGSINKLNNLTGQFRVAKFLMQLQNQYYIYIFFIIKKIISLRK